MPVRTLHVLVAVVVLLSARVGYCGGALAGTSPLGETEKIRFAWMQWQHFGRAGVSDEELFGNLENVGTTVFVDKARIGDQARARLARAHGIRYFGGKAWVDLYKHEREPLGRLAVNKEGLTCPQKWAAAKARCENPHGKFGSGFPAQTPCPLDERFLADRLFTPILDRAQHQWLEGMHIDFEAYGVYGFDSCGDKLCYCDECFGEYLRHRKFNDSVRRDQRYAWLKGRGLLDRYLERLHERLASILQRQVQRIRAVKPGFIFSAYPGFMPGDWRSAWRLQATARGLTAPHAPYVVVDVHYWQDNSRPWWETPHHAYTKLGLKHIMGSMGIVLFAEQAAAVVSPAQAMYEYAMASDGYWGWFETDFDLDDWRTFATVNQRLRQVENKLGDFLLRGRQVPPQVTLIEQTGSPLLDRSLVARRFEQGDRTLIAINNGNADYPVSVSLRIGGDSGQHWSLRDPIHDLYYTRSDGTARWTSDALREGVGLALEGRGERFLLLEPMDVAIETDRTQSIRSFNVTAHRSRPEASQPLPDRHPDPPADGRKIVFTPTTDGGYKGNNLSLVTRLAITGVDAAKPANLLKLQGYCREPVFSADGRRVAASVWVNGRGQIYLLDAATEAHRNISHNRFCDRSPSFSPDGERLAFVSDRDGQWDIYTMAADGSDVRRLTDSPAADRNPVVSPDGSLIVFISDRGGDFDVYVMGADGGGQRAVLSFPGNEYDATWSADSQFIAFSKQHERTRRFVVCRPDGRDAQIIRRRLHNIRSIRFSPDGQHLAAAIGKFHEPGNGVVLISRDLEAVDAGWKAPQKGVQFLFNRMPRMVRDNHYYAQGSGRPRAVDVTFTAVDFSPDGQHLLFCSDHGDDGIYRLYTIPVTGGEPVVIPGSESMQPVSADWSR